MLHALNTFVVSLASCSCRDGACVQCTRVRLGQARLLQPGGKVGVSDVWSWKTIHWTVKTQIILRFAPKACPPFSAVETTPYAELWMGTHPNGPIKDLK